MAKLLHTMIRVRDLERSLAFYEQAFGLEPVDRFDFDDFTLVYLRNPKADFELELTWNRDQRTPYTHGSGYGHLGVCVEDAAAERVRLDALGFPVRNLVEMRHGGEFLARFFFVEDPDGYAIEVLERGGRYR